MSAPILGWEDVPGEPTLVEVLYGLPNYTQGRIRVLRDLTKLERRPVLQALVDKSAQTMVELRASLGTG